MEQEELLRNPSFRVGIEAMTWVDDEIWGFMHAFNALVKVNVLTGEIYYIDSVPWEEPYKERLYGDIVRVDNWLILVPVSANGIAIYDLKKGVFFKVSELKEVHKDRHPIYKEDYKFAKGLQYKEYVYMFCSTYPAFLKIKITDFLIEYIDEWTEEVEARNGIGTAYFRNIYYDGKKTVYLPSSYTNLVMKYDLSNDCYSYYTVGEREDTFSDICYWKDMFWIASKNERGILAINNFSDTCYKRFEMAKGELFADLLKADDKIYAFSLDANRIFCISDYDDVKWFDFSEENRELSQRYSTLRKINEVYGISFLESCITVFSMQTQEHRKIPLIIERILQRKMITYLLSTNKFMNESVFSLKLYIETLIDIFVKEKDSVICMQTIGGKIWYSI